MLIVRTRLTNIDVLNYERSCDVMSELYRRCVSFADSLSGMVNQRMCGVVNGEEA